MFNPHLLIIIFGFLCVLASMQPKEWQENNKIRRNLCIALCLLFILQSGFRDYTIHLNDTTNYWNSYEDLKEESLKEQLRPISLVYKEYTDRDPGYKVFVKLTQLIWPDFRFFLVLVASIISIPICRIMYKYSPTISGVLIGACLYEALFVSFFNTGIRQTIAMGLSYFALFAFLDKKKILTILLLFIAYSIHSSTLIFLPIFLLLYNKKPKRILRWAIVSVPVIMYYARPIIAFIGEGTIMEGYAVDSTDNLGTPVFSTLVLSAALVTSIYSERIKLYEDKKLLFLCMAMSLVLTPASWVDSNFIRIVFYYLVFLIPLMSVIIEKAGQKQIEKTIMYGFMVAVFILLQ